MPPGKPDLAQLAAIEIQSNITDIFKLEGLVAVVTGGGSGLGEAIALGLAAFGARVIVLDRDSAGLDRVTQRLKERFGFGQGLELDVTRWEDVQAIASQIVADFEAVDILINSAGLNIRKLALDLTPDEFRRVVEVDLTGTFQVCRAFGQDMVARKCGSIINMSSVNGFTAMEKQSGYASAKAGVSQLTTILALEWAQAGVRVNALAPCPFHTPLVAEFIKTPGWYESLVPKIPAGRFGEPWEIVGPAVFLASQASSFITGQTLFIDGGWTII